MAIVLSDTTWCDLWAESQSKARSLDALDPTDITYNCPSSFGTGYKRDLELRNGIWLTFYRYQLHEDLTLVEIRSPEESSCLEWVFNLSSTFCYDCGTIVRSGQHHVLNWGSFGVEETGQLANQPRIELDIHVDLEQFSALIGDRCEILPLEVQRMLAGDPTVRMGAIDRITPTMQIALQQMLDCPYQGVMKQMYLESKSVEVLTLWLDAHTKQHVNPCLPDRDLDCIDRASKILLANVDNPPTLTNLARQVGLNDCSLKKGFKQVFGTTAFGYLHQCRMEKARLLLLDNNQSISAVAQAVGYTNLSAFSTAFRKKFGISPKSLQR